MLTTLIVSIVAPLVLYAGKRVVDKILTKRRAKAPKPLDVCTCGHRRGVHAKTGQCVMLNCTCPDYLDAVAARTPLPPTHGDL